MLNLPTSPGATENSIFSHLLMIQTINVCLLASLSVLNSTFSLRTKHARVGLRRYLHATTNNFSKGNKTFHTTQAIAPNHLRQRRQYILHNGRESKPSFSTWASVCVRVCARASSVYRVQRYDENIILSVGVGLID